MKIAILKPGESRTIHVKASADEEGDLRSCLAIVNYTPALCLTSHVVKQKPADKAKAATAKKSERGNKIEMAMSDKALTIDRLNVGQTAVFEYAIRSGDVETLPT